MLSIRHNFIRLHFLLVPYPKACYGCHNIYGSADLWAGYKALIWGWYVPSDCMLSLSCYAAIQYIIRPKRLALIFMGVFSACAVMSRLPSVVIIPILCILLVCTGNSFRSIIKNIIEYLIYVLLATSIILSLIYGNPLNYIDSWSSDNVITGHSDNPLLLFFRPFWESLLHDTEAYTALFTGVGLLWVGKKVHPSIKGAPTFLWCVLSTIVLFVILRVNFIYSYQNYGNIVNYYYVTFFFLMGMAILVPYINGKNAHIDKKYLLVWLTILGCSLCAAVGSDRSIRVAVCFPLFPALVMLVKKLKSPCARLSIPVIAMAFIMLIPIIKKRVVGYDNGLGTLTAKIHTIPTMNGLYTTADKEAFLRTTTTTILEIEESKGKNTRTLIIGSGRYPISYALGRMPVDLQKYHQKPESEDFVRSVAQHISDGKTDVVAYIPMPGSKDIDALTPIKVCELLKFKGFELKEVTDYADIWVKP